VYSPRGLSKPAGSSMRSSGGGVPSYGSILYISSPYSWTKQRKVRVTPITFPR